MGFYGPEPVTSATAYYVWTGFGEPGHFFVTAQGDAPNFTTGIQLVRDPHWVGGLRMDVMGWTGPRAPGSRPYTVHGTFPGSYLPRIVVAGANRTLVVEVKEIPFPETEQFFEKLSAVPAGVAS